MLSWRRSSVRIQSWTSHRQRRRSRRFRCRTIASRWKYWRCGRSRTRAVVRGHLSPRKLSRLLSPSEQTPRVPLLVATRGTQLDVAILRSIARRRTTQPNSDVLKPQVYEAEESNLLARDICHVGAQLREAVCVDLDPVTERHLKRERPVSRLKHWLDCIHESKRVGDREPALPRLFWVCDLCHDRVRFYRRLRRFLPPRTLRSGGISTDAWLRRDRD